MKKNINVSPYQVNTRGKNRPPKPTIRNNIKEQMFNNTQILEGVSSQ